MITSYNTCKTEWGLSYFSVMPALFLMHQLGVMAVCNYNRPFPLRRNGMQYTWRHARDVSEGLLGRILHCLYLGTWPTFGQLLLCVQGKYRAALTPIQSSSIDLFNSGRSKSVRLCLTLERVVGYHQVHDWLLSASGAVELVKTPKIYNYRRTTY